MAIKLNQEEFMTVVENLRRLSKTRTEIVINIDGKPTNVIFWKDKEGFTDDIEPYKNLDALYSFVLAFEELGEKLTAYKDSLVDENEPLSKTITALNKDLDSVFTFINSHGFFSLPYLWQKPSKPFDLLDMTSLVCEICTSLLSNSHPKLDNSLMNTTKNILKKAVTTIKDSAVKLTAGQYTWAGWGKINKGKNAKHSNIKASTYFTSLCCSALTKYISAWDKKPDALNMGFERNDLVDLIVGGLNWVSTRVSTNDVSSLFYKYDTDNELALYWGVFFLIAVSEAHTLLENAGLDKTVETNLYSKSEQLWKSLLDTTALNINNGSDLFESTTMQIDTPDTPAFYEDSSCLGSLTLALFKYAKEFETQYASRDYVLNYISSKLLEEFNKAMPDLIANNHYNIRAYYEVLKYKQSSQLSVPYSTMKKLINEIIDNKVDEMKSLIFSRLKQYEKNE